METLITGLIFAVPLAIGTTALLYRRLPAIIPPRRSALVGLLLASYVVWVVIVALWVSSGQSPPRT